MRVFAISCLVVTVAAAACSSPFGRHAAPVAPAVQPSTGNDTTPPPPIVQVRDYWRAASVSVLAWDEYDRGFGLRTSIDRRGILHGGLRSGDHRLYVDAVYAWTMGGFTHAAIMPDTLLLSTGGQRDLYACFYNHKQCSPMFTIGVRIADSLLRAHRDSLVVTFVRRNELPWTITLRRDLITAYLRAVDSIVAERRRVASR